MTKNITLAVDEELLARFRVLAAEERSTVNAMIRQFMEDRTGLAAKRREAREWMVARIKENIARDEEREAARKRGEKVEEESWKWSREDTYAERDFSRKRGS